MMHEYAPWRDEYYDKKGSGCPFCDITKNDENLLLFQAKNCFGIMNLYPYTLGAFMVIPYKHIDNLENLDDEIWLEINKYVKFGVQILKQKLNASGVNIGMNLGVAAGAGIEGHIHYHLVPRWERDTNFITTIGKTRIHGKPFEKQCEIIKSAYDEILKMAHFS